MNAIKDSRNACELWKMRNAATFVKKIAVGTIQSPLAVPKAEVDGTTLGQVMMAIGMLAIGMMAIGTMAIGTMAIGTMAIGTMVIGTRVMNRSIAKETKIMVRLCIDHLTTTGSVHQDTATRRVTEFQLCHGVKSVEIVAAPMLIL